MLIIVHLLEGPKVVIAKPVQYFKLGSWYAAYRPVPAVLDLAVQVSLEELFKIHSHFEEVLHALRVGSLCSSTSTYILYVRMFTSCARTYICTHVHTAHTYL